MISIRAEQVQAMRVLRAREREPRMLDHARHSFPNECAAMSPDELRSFVAHASSKAAAYGIEGVSGACRYLNLMFLFGRDFDVACRWAAEELASAGSGKIERLVAAARTTLDLER